MFGELLKRLGQADPPPLPEPDARLALAALMVRVARSDGDYADDEVARIDRILSARYGLSPFEATRIRRDAEALEAEAPDTVRFTRALKDAVPYEDREGVIESIELERELLEKVGTLGHRIDTSDLNPNALRNWVRDLLSLDDSELVLLFQSFGFKHGIPLDADFVFDVRCLPNPHYDPKLRDFTGRDSQVIAFLEANTDVEDMVEHIRAFVERWLPSFVRDNRSYLTVAIGCTGGRHRSVYLAERLAAYFGKERQVLVRHRELAE